VLATSRRSATLSVLIDGAAIVIEGFRFEAEARRYAKGLYADFISMGGVDLLKAEAEASGHRT
jgi:hypothetical protein